MTGVAVKVTLVPEQKVVAEAMMLTDGVTAVPTDIVITLLVAEIAEPQDTLLVITAYTLSPSVSVGTPAT